MNPEEIVFLRKRAYEFKGELGAGACGKTVLLRDPELDEVFVCKKYAPADDAWKQQLFANFLNEIKVLHRVYHRNVVRVFNHYVYRDRFAGYILMEYIQGEDICSYLKKHPEQLDSVFQQVVAGFRHLEENRILHRDIRPFNILVRNDGVAKIIDFGFGKQIAESKDFNRSISLNWWCDLPNEFARSHYDFTTEVYFVGKLFEAVIREERIESFPHFSILGKMCQPDPGKRIASFVDVDQSITKGLSEDEFTSDELHVYRSFSAVLFKSVSQIEVKAQFETDVAKVELELDQIYRNCLLEEFIAPNLVVRCFINGQYYYSSKYQFGVSFLRDFLRLLKSCSRSKKNIILANLQTKLGTEKRYEEKLDEDVPF